MLSMEAILGMIWTEGIEAGEEDTMRKDTTKIPPIRFNLELIYDPNTGKYNWVED